MTDVKIAYEAALDKLVEIVDDYNTEPTHRFAAIDRITELYRHGIVTERTERIMADPLKFRAVYGGSKGALA